MTVDEFRKSPVEPHSLTPPLRAMWHDTNGDWESAHRIVQDDDSREAAWVHAYLHRREGDEETPVIGIRGPDVAADRGSLESEWEEIVGDAVALKRGGQAIMQPSKMTMDRSVSLHRYAKCLI